MKKQDVDDLYGSFDNMFNHINQSQNAIVSGLTFRYSLDVEFNDKVLYEKKGDKTLEKNIKESVYNFTVYVKKAGHREIALQTIPYIKPANYDKFTMEFQVLSSIMSMAMETMLLQWNEIGEQLNKDDDLKDKVKIIV